MVNSLTDYEVSIIKNLLDNPDFKNQEIAGLINRYRGDAKSDVSSGRISNIKNNQIQKYRNIARCSDEEAQAFLEKVNNLKLSGTIAETGPISDSTLAILFPISSSENAKLNITETDQIECKQSFNMVMKTIAAFANNKGGYFAFGVKDKTWEVVGLNPGKLRKFQEFDLKDINQKIRTALGTDLQVQKTVYRVENKFVGIMYIAEAKIKPLIFTKSDSREGFAEGHIYYRYSGEDRLIAPLDLQKIIEDRIRDLSKTILTKHISQILDAGPTNSAVLNLETGEVNGASGKFVIDEKLLNEIEFIKEGEFKEKSGSPTLKLVGELTPTYGAQTNITLSNDPDAQKMTPKDPQKLWPLRQKDLINRVKEAFGQEFKFNGHDIGCIKLKHLINAKTRPDFIFKPHDKVGPQYSEKFAEWIIENINKDNNFTALCREAYRSNGNSYNWN